MIGVRAEEHYTKRNEYIVQESCNNVHHAIISMLLEVRRSVDGINILLLASKARVLKAASNANLD